MRLVLLIVLIAINSQTTASSNSLTELPQSLSLNKPLTAECFIWTDPLKLKEKNLEPGNYPTPLSFYAKKAVSGKCSESHHFQIFYRVPLVSSSSNLLKQNLSTPFCQKKAKSNTNDKSLPRYVYSARVGNKKEGFVSACLIAGSVSVGARPKTFYFEELFLSRLKNRATNA